VRQLTNDLYEDFPNWSPDGKQIAFTKAVLERDGGDVEVKNEAIYVMDSDGSNLRKLTEGQPFFDRTANWSPDGKKMVLNVWGPAAKGGQIWIMDTDGNNREMLCDFGRYPVWSPDGKKIAFTYITVPDWTSDIYVMDADGSNVNKITNRPSWYEDYPTWSPDGTRIVFSSFIYPQWDERDIYVMDADGSNIQQLTNTRENEYGFSWTAYSYAVGPGGKLKTTWGKIKSGIDAVK
jgi:TolB protein